MVAVVTDWLHDKREIRILPSIPYEHDDTVRTVERANQTMDNTITKILDLPRNKHPSRQHWAMAFTHALKIKNRLPSAASQGQSPISLWQPEVLDPRRFPLHSYGTLVAAHITLDTQNNGSGRSILGYYVGFLEDHRGEILVFNPKTRTTTVRHTYKALGLVEEQRLDDIIYVIDSPSPVTMTPAQTEQTQFIAPPPTPLPTRSTTIAPITSAAGAGIIPDSSIHPRGILAAPSPPVAHNPFVPKLTSDLSSPSDHFILDEVIRHVQTTHPSPLPQPDLSQPIVWDGTHYKRISPRTYSKSVKPFLRYVDRDFRDTSACTQFRITGVYLVTPNDTTLEPTYCYQFYDLHAYPQVPPCHQVLEDTNKIFTTPVSAAQRRANKVHAVATRGVTDKAMAFAQAMAHSEAPDLKAALLDELKSLSLSEHYT